MKIYTKTGDQGITSLYKSVNDQIRVPKSDPRIKLVGLIDEFNVSLGSAIVECKDFEEKYRQSSFYTYYGSLFGNRKNEYVKIMVICENIQRDLMFISSKISSGIIGFPQEIKNPTTLFEDTIDYYTEILPKLTKFKLMGGNKLMIALDNSRVFTRRVERKIIEYINKYPDECPKTPSTNTLLIYLNRLSDLFFTLSRIVDSLQEKERYDWNSHDTSYWSIINSYYP